MKPTQEDLLDARKNTIPDIIKPDLSILFCGINPGLYTTAVGHHFGRPGNRFWKLLYLSGLTPRLLDPSEQMSLLDVGIGITNFVSRTTAKADELTPSEIRTGKEILIQKVKKYHPRVLAILGIGVYKVGFEKREVSVGLQQERIGNTSIYVLPNPSGLQAGYSLEGMVEQYKKLYYFIHGNAK